MRCELAPSILAADFARLGEHVAEVAPYSGRIHADVMDGHYVPNLSIGPAVVRSLRDATPLPIEVHLMVTDPAAFVQPFADAGANSIIFHIEVVPDPAPVVDSIRALGLSPGLALHPSTDPDTIAGHLRFVDVVTVMTVNPGFGGQEFIASMIPKVRSLRALLGPDLQVDIEVDGGVDTLTAKRCKDAGANVFVAGNSVFGSKDPAGAARELLRTIQGEMRG